MPHRKLDIVAEHPENSMLKMMSPAACMNRVVRAQRRRQLPAGLRLAAKPQTPRRRDAKMRASAAVLCRLTPVGNRTRRGWWRSAPSVTYAPCPFFELSLS